MCCIPLLLRAYTLSITIQENHNAEVSPILKCTSALVLDIYSFLCSWFCLYSGKFYSIDMDTNLDIEVLSVTRIYIPVLLSQPWTKR